MTKLIIREVTLQDIPTICDIYNYHVLHTAVTFETQAVTAEEMHERIAAVLSANFPYYVGEIGNEMVGFCYLHTWNNRSAYSSTAEVTIYLDRRHAGKGYGTQLYDFLFKQVDTNRFHTLIAGICIPNDASVRLHEKFGFIQVSCMKEVGYKFGKWRDVGHWQRMLTGK